MKSPSIARTFAFAFDERVMGNPQMSLMDFTLETGIPDDVIRALRSGKNVVSVPVTTDC